MPYRNPHENRDADLEVVVLNWNGGELLFECLRSVLAVEPRHDVLITMVDNASTDGSAERARAELGDRVRIIESPENVGFARGNNLALRDCRARHAMLLNSDATLPRDAGAHALDRLIEFIDSRPDAGVVGPRIVSESGELEESTGDSVSLLNVIKNNVLRRSGLPRRVTGWLSRAHWPHDRVREVDWVSGAALLVRGDVLRSGCLLDEGYFMYTEDVEWCHRIRRAGWKILFTPDVTIVHRRHGSSDAEARAWRKRLHREGLIRFTELHPSPTRLLLRWALRLSLMRVPEAVGPSPDVTRDSRGRPQSDRSPDRETAPPVARPS